MSQIALLTGISGQDGSYLAELLLETGYEVYGIVRRSSTINTSRIDHLLFPKEQITLLYGDLINGIDGIIYDLKPDLIFNIASQSHVRVSFDIPIFTLDVNAIGPARILEAIKNLKLKYTRFYQASSSEMFGSSAPPQNEKTPFNPCSPYGIAKLSAYWMTKLYREAYGIFACNGILFNHESPRRGETFVTKKIVRAAVRIKMGKQNELVLGNIDAMRDWGHSKDYVDAIYKIITHSEPDDFVVATGEHYSVKVFLEKVFNFLYLNWKDYVVFDNKFLRPKEVQALCGDSTKIKTMLGWKPFYDIDSLICEMIANVWEQEKNEVAFGMCK